jgi:hypothetical protein
MGLSRSLLNIALASRPSSARAPTTTASVARSAARLDTTSSASAHARGVARAATARPARPHRVGVATAVARTLAARIVVVVVVVVIRASSSRAATSHDVVTPRRAIERVIRSRRRSRMSALIGSALKAIATAATIVSVGSRQGWLVVIPERIEDENARAFVSGTLRATDACVDAAFDLAKKLREEIGKSSSS